MSKANVMISKSMNMKTIALVLLLGFACGCAEQHPLPGMADSAAGTTPSDAVGQVSNDTELMRQVLLMAGAKGTLVGGLTKAAEDSLIGIRMREALILSNRTRDLPPLPPSAIPVVHKPKPVQHRDTTLRLTKIPDKPSAPAETITPVKTPEPILPANPDNALTDKKQ
jgi:hypothetical protein